MATFESLRVRRSPSAGPGDSSEQPRGTWSAPPAPNGDAVDVAEIWDTLHDHRWLMLAMLLLGLLGMLGATLLSRMQFKATGGLYLGDLDERGVASGAPSEALDFLGGGRAELGTEIEVLKSESLVSRAILESGLNLSVTRSDRPPLRYLEWRMARRDPGLVDPVSRELTARGALLIATPHNQAYQVRFSNDSEYALFSKGKEVARGKLLQPLTTSELRLTLEPGSERLPKAGSIYDIVVSPLDDVLERAFDALAVTSPRTAPGQSVNVLRLEFSNESPSLARSFLERLMRGYLEQRQSWKTEKASAVEGFVSNQLSGMRESLDDAERRLADYKKSSGVVALSDEARSMIEQLGKFEEQRVAARLQVSALHEIQGVLNNKKSSAPLEAYLLGEAEDTVLANLGSSLTQAQEELKRMEHQFTPDAPVVREQRAQVDAQREMVKNYVATRRARAQEQLGTLNRIISQSNEKLKSVPNAELELARLVRDAEVFSKMYSYLLERKQQAAIVKAATMSDNRILDLPKVRYREASPKLGLRLGLGALLGLFSGLAFALLRQRFAGTFQGAREVRRRFPNVPVFAVLPKKPKPAKSRRGPSLEGFISAPGTAFREAFRLLRANVYRSTGPALSRVITVTSFDANDGKTMTTLALAATLASEGNRVLVVSAEPNAQRSPEPGLAEILAGQHHWSEVGRVVAVPDGEFVAISAGNTDSMAPDHFSSLKFAEFLAEARMSYSFILIDAPSLSGASEALLAAAYSDLALVVLRLHHSRRQLAEEHLARLTVTTECGLVINDPESKLVDDRGTIAIWVPNLSFSGAKSRPASGRVQSAVTVLRRPEATR
ncbi:MAG: GumC family protein [Myxococcota bacterium]